jgi:hypothetical protein
MEFKMFSTLKTYAVAIAVAAGSAMLIALRVLSGQNRRLRAKNERFEAQRKHTKQILEQDIATDVQTDERLEVLAEELENGNSPSELTNPNVTWLRDRKDRK